MLNNSEQRENWNGSGGQSWVRNQERIDLGMAGFGQRAIERLLPTVGDRILDVGCGSGTMTLALAQAVGESGQVTGVDFSEPLLELARQRSLHLPQVHWVHGDASEVEIESGFDAIFSRFGVMFFDNPEKAFFKLGQSLRLDGKLTFVCWQGPDRNPWVGESMECLLPFLPEAPSAPIPNAPGAFGLADPDRTRMILSNAGFHDIQIEGVQEDIVWSKTGAQEALKFFHGVGPCIPLDGWLS